MLGLLALFLNLTRKLRSGFTTQCVNTYSTLLNQLVNLILMIIIVSQRCIHIRQGYIVIAGDFVCATAQAFVPDYDILHGNSTTGNAWFAT